MTKFGFTELFFVELLFIFFRQANVRRFLNSSCERGENTGQGNFAKRGTFTKVKQHNVYFCGVSHSNSMHQSFWFNGLALGLMLFPKRNEHNLDLMDIIGEQ